MARPALCGIAKRHGVRGDARARVLDVIDDPELAWAFLTQEWPFADDAARPLDKLARDEVEDVVNAAPSFGMSFT